MDPRRELLLASAARLYSLGVDLEMAREELRRLVGQGTPYGSHEMRRAYERFNELDRQWQSLQRQYISLQSEISETSEITDNE